MSCSWHVSHQNDFALSQSYRPRPFPATTPIPKVGATLTSLPLPHVGNTKNKQGRRRGQPQLFTNVSGGVCRKKPGMPAYKDCSVTTDASAPWKGILSRDTTAVPSRKGWRASRLSVADSDAFPPLSCPRPGR